MVLSLSNKYKQFWSGDDNNGCNGAWIKHNVYRLHWNCLHIEYDEVVAIYYNPPVWKWNMEFRKRNEKKGSRNEKREGNVEHEETEKTKWKQNHGNKYLLVLFYSIHNKQACIDRIWKFWTSISDVDMKLVRLNCHG